MTLFIPEDPNDVTAAWISDVLATAGEPFDASTVTVSPVASLTAQLHRVTVTGVHHGARTFIWKHSHSDAATRSTFARSYEREVEFYREWSTIARARVPRCYVARYERETNKHVLLLEDLAESYTSLSPAEGITAEQAAGMLRELALLHASMWGQVTADRRFSVDETTSFFESCRRDYKDVLVQLVGAPLLGRLEGYGRELTRQAALIEREPVTLVHADAHPGNAMFPRNPADRVVLLDWQGWQFGTGVFDVARALVLGMDTAERRGHQDELLNEYASALGAEGAGGGSSALREAYRTAAGRMWFWAVTFARRHELWDAPTRAAMPALMTRAAEAALEASA